MFLSPMKCTTRTEQAVIIEVTKVGKEYLKMKNNYGFSIDPKLKFDPKYQFDPRYNPKLNPQIKYNPRYQMNDPTLKAEDVENMVNPFSRKK